jgi:hypothetical protein
MADPSHYAYSAENRESTKQQRVTVLNSDDEKIARLPVSPFPSPPRLPLAANERMHRLEP